MKPLITYMKFALLLPLSLRCMEQQVHESEEHEIQISSISSNKLLGKEVPQSILKELEVKFGSKSKPAEPCVDFFDNQLVIYEGPHILADNGLDKPRFGRITKDPNDSRLTYFKDHNLDYYKILVSSQTVDNKTQNFFTYIRVDHLRAIPLQLRSHFKESY